MHALRTLFTFSGLVVLLLGMMGCSSNGQSTPATTTSSPPLPMPTTTSSKPLPDDTFGLLVKVNGQVEMNRQQWASGQWSPVSVGAVIADDDLIEVSAGTATILCPDLSLQEMIDRLDNSPCPRTTTSGRFSYEGYQIRGSVRSIDDEVPYILYPRQALILDDRPLLRWHDTGAASYWVALEVDGDPIWDAADVTSTELHYPDEAPALEPEVTYQLVVTDTDTMTSSLEDATRGTGFRLVSEEERATIADQQAQIAALDELGQAEQQLAFAVYLISRSPDDPPAFGYWGEAWLRLEEVTQVHDTPPVWRWQGKALRAMRLPNEAEQAYQQALQQAETQGNIAEQAAALTGLWRVKDEQDYLDEAIRLYEELGNEQQAEALREAK